MSDPEDDEAFRAHDDPIPGPSRWTVGSQPPPPPLQSPLSAAMVVQRMREAHMQRFQMGLRPDRPRPGILSHRPSAAAVTSFNQQSPRGTIQSRGIPATIPQPSAQNPRPSATVTSASQAAALAQAQVPNMVRPGMGQRFPNVPASTNAYMPLANANLLGARQPQPTGLSAPLSIPQSIRPAAGIGNQLTASALVQTPTSSQGSQILRATNFHPNLPMAPEIMDDLMRQAAANVRGTMPAPTIGAKRTGSPTGPPTKRQASNSLKMIPYSKEVIWDTESEIDFVCPLCFEQFKEPHITQCGHTYCLSCIERFTSLKRRCPNCNLEVRRETVTPNRAIHQLILKHRRMNKNISTEVHIAAGVAAEKSGNAFEELDLYAFFQKKYKDLTLEEVEVLLSMLGRKKEKLQVDSAECRNSLVRDFLTQLRKVKEAKLNELLEDLSLINSDLAFYPPDHKAIQMNGDVTDHQSEERKESRSDELPGLSADMSIFTGKELPPVKDIHFNATDKELRESGPSIAQRKLKIHSHFPSLTTMYLTNCRPGRIADEVEEDAGGVKTNNPRKHLKDFEEALVQISRFTTFKLLATLTYNITEGLVNTNIVSTIEFDRDRDFFAIAGVMKKIRLFEYGSVIASTVRMQAPNGEIACNSKISCISYSPFYKNKLASADYDGRVIVYDTSTCETVSTFAEHEKRVWSVDFCDADPRFVVSGSDDTKVKLWSVTDQNSAMTLQTAANICCVKFVPGSAYTIAFGSADHCIHYYDLRQPKSPLRTFDGHKKAVSYVQFASNTELISASTDSNLKLWDLNAQDPVRSYVGHVNDKNFVGLTTDGNYVACGSEDNAVYIYYKGLPYPLLNYKFENYRSMIHPARQEEVVCEFVSAVAWRTGSPVIVAANSQGIIKVLELI